MKETEFILLKEQLFNKGKVLVSVHKHQNSMMDYCFVASIHRCNKDIIQTIQQNKKSEQMKNYVPRNYLGYLLQVEQKKFK